MDIIDAMDCLLISAKEQGRKPERWLVREDDWHDLKSRFHTHLIADPKTIGQNSWKGVPVEFARLNENEIVGLVDTDGRQDVASG